MDQRLELLPSKEVGGEYDADYPMRTVIHLHDPMRDRRKKRYVIVDSEALMDYDDDYRYPNGHYDVGKFEYEYLVLDEVKQ